MIFLKAILNVLTVILFPLFLSGLIPLASMLLSIFSPFCAAVMFFGPVFLFFVNSEAIEMN